MWFIAFSLIALGPLPSATAATQNVDIRAFAFDPTPIEIRLGDAIAWTNRDGATHTATGENGAFDTGNLGQGQSKSVTFNQAGSYSYFCAIHPWMRGKVIVTAANAPPTVAVSAPAEGAGVSGTVEFRGTASDPDAGDAIVARAWIDGVEITGLVMNAGLWVVTWDSTRAANGAHVFRIEVTDRAGASKEAVRNFVVDNAPPVSENRAPTVSITTPTAGANLGGQVPVRGAASDPDQDNLVVELLVDDRAIFRVEGATEWSYLWDTTKNWRNGPHTMVARVSDGKLVTNSTPVPLTIANAPPPDNRVPVVKIGGPAQGATVSGFVTINGTALDRDGDDVVVEVSIDGGPWETAKDTTLWSYRWDTTKVANGEHTLVARASDLWTSAESVPVRVKVANSGTASAAPTVTIADPADGATVSGFISVRGSASDPDGDVVTVEVRLDGGPWRPAIGGASWSFPLDAQALTPGRHSIEARASDGVTTSAIANVTVLVASSPVSANGTSSGGGTAPPTGGNDTPALGLAGIGLAFAFGSALVRRARRLR